MSQLPLLALPGLLNDERLWRQQAAALGAERTVTVVPSLGQPTMEALAAQALARAPGERFALAGFSMGGYVALEVMRQAPQRVAALALCDTSARPDTPEATAMRRQMIAASATGFDAAIAALMQRLVHPSRLQDAALVGLMTAMAGAVGRERFVQQQEAVIARVDSRPLLGSIACPTLVLCGRDDQVTPLALHDELAAGIDGATQVVVDACGHMAPLERPDAVTAALRAWLAGR